MPRKKATLKSAILAIDHAPASIIPSWMHTERTRVLTATKDVNSNGKSVVYWLQRDMRTRDNWALFFASHLSKSLSVPLRVVYIPPPPDTHSQPLTLRYVNFLIDGLRGVESELAKDSIPFEVILPTSTVSNSLNEYCARTGTSPSAVICDMCPLRHNRLAKEEMAPLLDENHIPLYQVDAHNIIPVWEASEKREVGARTLRPKINRLLPIFKTEFPDLDLNQKQAFGEEVEKVDWDLFKNYLKPDLSVTSTNSFVGGSDAGMRQFQKFLKVGLKNYESRNNPNNSSALSNLSPWINFGHISFQRLAIDVKKHNKYPNSTAMFIEEGIVRRELSDNFVYYEDCYDSLDAAAGWARDSLELHESDTREWIFTLEEFENAETHDDLWNAAQLQLKKEGKMHGFLRMYWAKKVLEWTPSPATALEYAQYLNDKYALDGHSPNGFVGIAWSIMGIHDMGWKERPIFGKIRFMNYAGCKRKFKVNEFVLKYPPAAANARKKLGEEKKDIFSGKKRKTTKS